MRRVLAISAFAVLAVAVPADAATVSVQGQGQSGHARFEAATGELNRVSVSRQGEQVSVSDTGVTITAGAGCEQTSTTEVRCPARNVKLALGDLDDTIVAQGGVTVDVDAGDGNDRITARNSTRDSITCGAGDDAGEADIEDEVAADCEGIVKPIAPPNPLEPQTPQPPVVQPTPGESVAAKVKSGVIYVKLPGASQATPLDPTQPLPLGTVINAGHGVMTLTTASNQSGGTQTADVTGGSFSVAQKPGPFMITELRMRGGNFGSCKARAASRTTARAAGKKRVRRLWGSGKGRFRTRGKHSSATVRGTVWTVEDRCDGTLTRVERGVVVVHDFARNRTKVVRRGQKYLAAKRRARR